MGQKRSPDCRAQEQPLTIDGFAREISEREANWSTSSSIDGDLKAALKQLEWGHCVLIHYLYVVGGAYDCKCRAD